MAEVEAESAAVEPEASPAAPEALRRRDPQAATPQAANPPAALPTDALPAEVVRSLEDLAAQLGADG